MADRVEISFVGPDQRIAIAARKKAEAAAAGVQDLSAEFADDFAQATQSIADDTTAGLAEISSSRSSALEAIGGAVSTGITSITTALSDAVATIGGYISTVAGYVTSAVAARDAAVSAAATVGAYTGRADRPLYVLTGANGYRWLTADHLTIRHKQIDAHEVVAQNVGSGVVGRSQVPSLNFTGANGRRWLHIDPEVIQHKQIDRHEADIAALKGGSATLYKAMAVYAEIQHIIIYGQSLSVGQGGAPPIGTTPLSYAKRSFAGVRSQDGGGTASANWASLVDLAESTSAQGGETIAYGMAKMFRQRYLAEKGIDLAALNQKLLFSAPGQGAQTIAQLSAPGTYYTRLQTDMANAKIAAGTKPWAPQLLVWIQGESEYPVGTTSASYKSALQTLRSMIEAYGQSLTGDTTMSLPLLMYQCASHLNYGASYPNIALAQLELAQSETYMAMATPCYHFPFASTLDPHLGATGYQWMGAYFGSGLFDWVVNGIKPVPLAPSSVHRSGNMLLARFPVSSGLKLQLDTTNVALQTNYGLSVVDGTGNAQTISATPYFITADTIAIPCTNTPAAGWKLRNGFTGGTDTSHGLSNICDNNPLIYDAAGLNKTMWNHAPIFEKVVI